MAGDGALDPEAKVARRLSELTDEQLEQVTDASVVEAAAGEELPDPVEGRALHSG